MKGKLKILLPTDFSASSEVALSFASGIAKYFDSDIIILNVYESVLVPAEHGYEFSDARIHNDQKAINSFMEEAKKKALMINPGIQCSLLKREGDPASEIIKTIEKEEIDLVIVGSRGKNSI